MKIFIGYDELNQRTKNIRPSAGESYDKATVGAVISAGRYTRAEISKSAQNELSNYDGSGIPVKAMCLTHIGLILEQNNISGEVDVDIDDKGITFVEV